MEVCVGHVQGFASHVQASRNELKEREVGWLAWVGNQRVQSGEESRLNFAAESDRGEEMKAAVVLSAWV